MNREPNHDEYVSELFHENTKQHRSDERFIERVFAANYDAAFRRIISPTYKVYPGARRIALPRTFRKSKRGFDDALLGRRSRRDFDKAPLGFQAAAKLLHYTYGVTGALGPGRSASAAGARRTIGRRVVPARSLSVGSQRRSAASGHLPFRSK